MLNIIDEIQNGLAIDHIKAGTAIGLMDLLGIRTTAPPAWLDPRTRSRKSASGRKGHHQGGGRCFLAEPGCAGLP